MEKLTGVSFKRSWDEITIAEFFVLDEIDRNNNITQTEKNLQILSVLSGIDKNEFLQIKNDDIIKFLSTDLIFLKTEIKGEIQEYFTIEGKKYKLVRNVDDLTSGQFIDMMNYIKDHNSIMDNLHLILTVLLIPTIELKPFQLLYNKVLGFVNKNKWLARIARNCHIKPFSEKIEGYLQTPANSTSEALYNSMKITDAIAISVFFYQLEMVYAEIIRVFSLVQLQNQLNLALKILENQENKTQEMTSLQNRISIIVNGLGSSV